MLRFSDHQPFDLRVSDLPFPSPRSDHERIANTLWLLENNPGGQAPLPAREDDAPSFAALTPRPSDRTLADRVLARLGEAEAPGAGTDPESAETPPQIGQSLLAQSSRSSPTQPRKPAITEAQMADFFKRHYDLVNKVASQYGVDPALILGLSALESSWGTHHFATKLNNPAGMTPDGKTPDMFPSFDAAWEKWGDRYGARVQNVGSDVEDFLDRLLIDNRNAYGPTGGGNRRGAYNSANPAWKTSVGNTIRSVQRRLPQWLATMGSVP